jgi:hypothetical protein
MDLALRRASGMATPALASWRMELKVGDLIDAQFDDGKWFDAVVVDVKLVPAGEGTYDEVKVHYRGWKPNRDAWADKPYWERTLATRGVIAAPPPGTPRAPPCRFVDMAGQETSGIGNQIEGLARVAAIAEACALTPVVPAMRASHTTLARACKRFDCSGLLAAFPAGADAETESLRVRNFHWPQTLDERQRCALPCDAAFSKSAVLYGGRARLAKLTPSAGLVFYEPERLWEHSSGEI